MYMYGVRTYVQYAWMYTYVQYVLRMQCVDLEVLRYIFMNVHLDVEE